MSHVRENIIKRLQSLLPLNKNYPSKVLHYSRNTFNQNPSGNLELEETNNTIQFVDITNGQIWTKMPWYYNIFHNPIANVKLLNYDCDFVPNALSSSEIIVCKKNIINNCIDISLIDYSKGSFNYRDFSKSNPWRHFVADIIPDVCYIKAKKTRALCCKHKIKL